MRNVEHTVDYSSLAPKKGERVQVTVSETISHDEAKVLLAKYANRAAPDGQASLHMPSEKLGGAVLPYLVDNFDGNGPFINTDYH